MNPIFLKKLIELYLLEDGFFSDITTDSLQLKGKRKAIIKAKDNFLLAGVVFLKTIMSIVDNDFNINISKNDGEFVKEKEKIATIEADINSLLLAERLMLNILQRLSGIATKTRNIANLVEPYSVKITDTRKTTPGFRYFEKYAVRVGGGVNHRMGLFDAVLIKDNHIKASGAIKEVVNKIKNSVSYTAKIEVECENLEMVKEAVESGADIVMLDNMSITAMKKAVNTFKGKVLFEASGNIDENNIVEVAKTGVDFISLGAVTHHSCWVDISMKLE